MRLLVLLSGIVDSKWPLTADPAAAGALPRKLSPFDESALECALKLRDADPSVRISATVVAPRVEETLLRTVASHRLDGVAGLEIAEAMLWDARAYSALLAAIVTREAGADLVLLGREFGDGDDGVLAPCLAEALQWPLVGLAQEIVRNASGWDLLRERGELEEHIHLPGPLLASVTNDRRNRLRHPLMKNVAMAKKQAFAITAADAATPAVRLQGLREGPVMRLATPCRMIRGSINEQAAELAVLLRGRS